MKKHEKTAQLVQENLKAKQQLTQTYTLKDGVMKEKLNVLDAGEGRMKNAEV